MESSLNSSVQEHILSDPTQGREEKDAGNEVIAGGYNKEKPPEDDCCPICFDAFCFPCKTSCGHWFCCSCILRHWRYTTGFKPCKCPMCGCMITKLVPEQAPLNQQGEDAGKVLNDVHQYNSLNAGGLFGLYLKALTLPVVIRSRLREYFSLTIFRCIFQAMRFIGLLLGILYDMYDLHFFPNGGLGVRLLFEIFGCALVLFLFLDGIWYRWRRSRRLRRLNEAAGLEQM